VSRNRAWHSRMKASTSGDVASFRLCSILRAVARRCVVRLARTSVARTVCSAGLSAERMNPAPEIRSDRVLGSKCSMRTLHSGLEKQASRPRPLVGNEPPSAILRSSNVRFHTRATADCVQLVSAAIDRDVHPGESAKSGATRIASAARSCVPGGRPSRGASSSPAEPISR
jgi:hypothetical protein